MFNRITLARVNTAAIMARPRAALTPHVSELGVGSLLSDEIFLKFVVNTIY